MRGAEAVKGVLLIADVSMNALMLTHTRVRLETCLYLRETVQGSGIQVEINNCSSLDLLFLESFLPPVSSRSCCRVNQHLKGGLLRSV